MMKSRIKSILGRIRTRCSQLIKSTAKKSYSQCGEDLIMRFLLKDFLGLEKPTYLDIGAHHPTYLSNTYLFYTEGSHGVCVEPDPHLHQEIQRKRKRDVCLNIGIGEKRIANAALYISGDRLFNTFSKNIACQMAPINGDSSGRTASIDIVPINEIIADYFDPCPNLISIDTEGMDMEILQGMDFSRHRPEVFCIETLTSTLWEKITDIVEYLKSKEYSVYADTMINTIFVENRCWGRLLENRACRFNQKKKDY